jgi:hypothetical protein
VTSGLQTRERGRCHTAVVVEADWGFGEGPKDFQVRGREWDPVDSDDADDLEEVAAAREQGWFPLSEAPLWCFVPAIWPARARAWIRDRRVRHGTRQCDDGRVERFPWTAADHFEIEADYNGTLREYGVPPRPGGRIWVLRPPAGYATLDDVLDDIWAGWGRDEPPAPAFTEHAARRVLELFGRQEP